MIEQEHTIVFRARWIRWLPWPKRQIAMSKVSTYPEAEHWAKMLADSGCTDVQIVWPR